MIYQILVVQRFKIGPFYANSHEVATTLLEGLMANSKGEVVTLDMPLSNTKGFDWLKTFQPKLIQNSLRMVKGSAPMIDWSGVYAITDLALG